MIDNSIIKKTTSWPFVEARKLVSERKKIYEQKIMHKKVIQKSYELKNYVQKSYELKIMFKIFTIQMI